MRKIQICIRLTWNLTGSCGQQQRFRGWSRMVVNKTVPRWRTAAILKIVISPYLCEKSSDFHDILYTAADFELDERHVIKTEKVALDRLRVDRTYFLSDLLRISSISRAVTAIRLEFFTILLTLGQIFWIYLKLYNMVLVCVRHDVDTSTVWRKMLNQQTKNDNCAARGLLRCSTNWCWMFCSRLKEFCCTFSEKYFEKWLITAAVLYVHSQHKIMFITTEGIERISCSLSGMFHSGCSVKAELCDRCCLLACLSVCLSICQFVNLWAG